MERQTSNNVSPINTFATGDLLITSRGITNHMTLVSPRCSGTRLEEEEKKKQTNNKVTFISSLRINNGTQ